MSRRKAACFSGSFLLATVLIGGGDPVGADQKGKQAEAGIERPDAQTRALCAEGEEPCVDVLKPDQGGWQIGLKFGRGTLEESFGDPEVRPKSFDDRADASAIEVAYFFNRYVGVQAGYHEVGTFQGIGSSCPFDPKTCRESLALYAPAVAEADVAGWSLAVVPSWPLSNRFAAYGKLGVFARDTKVSTDVELIDGGRDLDRLSSTDLLTGVGLRCRFGKSLGALVEYQHADLETAALGMTWSF